MNKCPTKQETEDTINALYKCLKMVITSELNCEWILRSPEHRKLAYKYMLVHMASTVMATVDLGYEEGVEECVEIIRGLVKRINEVKKERK